MLGDFRELLGDGVEGSVELGEDRGGIGLIVNIVEHPLQGRLHAIQCHAHQVRGVVGAASLPRSSGQVRRDRVFRADVRIGSDPLHSGQAAGD